MVAFLRRERAFFLLSMLRPAGSSQVLLGQSRLQLQQYQVVIGSSCLVAAAKGVRGSCSSKLDQDGDEKTPD